MNIAGNINTILKKIPEHVKLVAVSKTKTFEDILEAYNAGQRIFGENRVQELMTKNDRLSKNPDTTVSPHGIGIEWHFIGHLQTNKVKYIAPFVSLIHSIDSLKLLKTIDKEAAKNKRVIDCLLQINISREEIKNGLNEEEAAGLLKSGDFSHFKNIRITGLMGMATYTNDENLLRSEFKTLANLFEDLKNNYFKSKPEFKEISMGMSSDYKIAIDEGSTMVRVGSLIFGARK
ncbi:MAG: YggS family pyridoxal phosphate-dependent enzyme [Bacteroidota bacterium]